MASTLDCKHKVLNLHPSPFAELAGYIQPSLQKRTAATTKSGRPYKASTNTHDLLATFPAPLVLPFDDLNYDPDYEPQDFKSWMQCVQRNKVSASRQTIYIARVPEITKHVAYMRTWTAPNLHRTCTPRFQANPPSADVVIDYISAFYHGLPVKQLPTRLKWTSWDDAPPTRKQSVPAYIALQHGSETTRIRTRTPPDAAFPAQVNLNDVLDGAMRILPADAFALLLLTDHDMWEDEDDFCCGRAYGASRVCVVQTARYHPDLDVTEGLDRTHMWPLSHCKDFVDGLCAAEDLEPRAPTQRQIKESRAGPMRRAVDAAVGKMSNTDSVEDGEALWFSRLARTVSHELAHCFAFDHCVYYACNSQGTAGMREDVRQPPYLCPVCEAKISHAIVCEGMKGDEEERKLWIRERCLRLREFCAKLEREEKGTAMWSGLNAWLKERLLGL